MALSKLVRDKESNCDLLSCLRLFIYNIVITTQPMTEL
jgi:hypothetical protein